MFHGQGVLLGAGGTESLDGLLDDVRIYNRALSPTGIQALAAGEDPPDRGPVECWGSNDFGESDAPAGNFIQIASGCRHNCGIRDDGSMACWGSNFSGESTPRTGTWDRISAGLFSTCSIDLSTKPWEDDFAPGQKDNEANDCAYIHTYDEERGEWGAGNCSTGLTTYYACKSRAYGGWRIVPGNGYWDNGFNSCGGTNVEWAYDAPATRDDNYNLQNQIQSQLGAGEHKVWMNYTDVRSEGVWRQAHWLDTLEPIYDNGHCGQFYEGLNRWRTVPCDNDKQIFCEKVLYLNGDWHRSIDLFAFAPWDFGSRCSEYFGSGTTMFLPTSQAHVDDIWESVPDYWVRYTDINYPGHWEDDMYDPD